MRGPGFGLGLSEGLTSLVHQLFPYTEAKEEDKHEAEDEEEDKDDENEDEEDEDEDEDEEEDEDGNNYYALGWCVQREEDEKENSSMVAFHTGSWSGVQAYLVRDIEPREGCGPLSIIALSNIEGKPLPITEIVDEFYEGFLSQQQSTRTEEDEEKRRRTNENKSLLAISPRVFLSRKTVRDRYQTIQLCTNDTQKGKGRTYLNLLLGLGVLLILNCPSFCFVNKHPKQKGRLLIIYPFGIMFCTCILVVRMQTEGITTTI